MNIEKKINKISKTIYENYVKHCRKKGKVPYSKDVENKLCRLNPGVNRALLIEQYYSNKISKEILVVIAAFLLLTAAVIGSVTNSKIDKDNQVYRNDYGKGDYYLNLEADSDNGSYDIEIKVNERKYKKEEISKIMDQIAEDMRLVIRGDNENLDYVTTDLNLVTNIDKYPIEISWETNNYGLIRTDGKIGDEEITPEGARVNLKMILGYFDYKQEYIYEVILYPQALSYEEQYKNEIISSIQEAQKESEYDDFFTLPEIGSDGYISWNEAKEPVAIIMAILSGIALVAVWVGVDNDLTKEYRKRNQSLRLEYSEFVSKLQLLISSGMTLRSAFERMGEDYKESIARGGSKKYVYEELIICVKQMKDGVSENKCYESFGNRCTLLSYRKLASLLTQNLKKGTTGMVAALSNETKLAFEERKMAAKKQGEEAQTKLLFPMIIMLAVVMIIIMIPAYMSFGS